MGAPAPGDMERTQTGSAAQHAPADGTARIDRRHPQHARRVLLVFGERDTAAMLDEAIAFHGMEGARVGSGAEALVWVQAKRPDLIVMDLAQPDMDGLVLCADLRSRTDAPVIVCGDAAQRREALLAFRLGADDFVAKPFDVDDLLARCEVALRRSAARQPLSLDRSDGQHAPAHSAMESAGTVAPSGPMMNAPAAAPPEGSFGRDGRTGASAGVGPAGSDVSAVGPLELDHTHHRVAVGGREVRLSRSEYLLLGALMGRPDELLSRLELARAVWGEQLASVGRPIDQHMYRLRSKLQQTARAAGVPAPTIVSVPGFGYRLLADEDSQQLRRAS